MSNNVGVGGCRSNPQAPVVIPESLAFICNRYAFNVFFSTQISSVACAIES